MKIEQDFNDGRYHEDDDDKEDTPQELAIDLNHIKKLFFSVSGSSPIRKTGFSSVGIED
ncbi:BEM_HP_G0118590.mRNA.1.CDS.1 [Saccharomyces cerevisiae]|nr:BEM_HP_G0118590.mRNA.1.CDS.1 [Saccharomyces cerevisiae]CAI6402856.1 BEM_HP_G0118590.mRNA.1.CDS.1 [Saccharomyces cerevisiae]